jgi:hypothetical protein
VIGKLTLEGLLQAAGAVLPLVERAAVPALDPGTG